MIDCRALDRRTRAARAGALAARVVIGVAAVLAASACTVAGPAGGDHGLRGGRSARGLRSYSADVQRGRRAGSAERVLTLLASRAKGRAPMTGYRRDAFGPAWTDDTRAPWGGNGCDTRDDILRHDLSNLVLAADGCTVESGTLHDPYTGSSITFRRGVGTSEAVQIDHVVALGDAWATGAGQLSASRRALLANDPLELLAVDGPTNEAKGDADAASWLSPNKAFRCAYVARQLAVKQKYALWVTHAEAAAIGRVLAACPDQDLPTEAAALHRSDPGPPSTPRTGLPTAAPHRSAPLRSAPPRQLPESTANRGRAAGIYYPNCDAARAAGAAPLHRGQPGYRPALDGDNDGLACE